MSDSATTTGTVDDVAAFFRVDTRTVQRWISGSKRRLTYWREGRLPKFGEAAVVELRVKFLKESRAYEPGEAEEIARREWRDLLEVRRTESEQVAELRLRVERLEAQSAIRNPQSAIERVAA